MFFSAAKFNHLKQTASKAGEPIEVTAEQLEELFKASGMKASEIKMHLNISKIMGGSVLVGDKLFKLKEEKKKKEKKNDKQAKKRGKKAS
jgi:hypothetical protein